MFLARRPSAAAIDRFLRESQDRPLSYSPIGIVRNRPEGRAFDEAVATIGRGRADFDSAAAALRRWRQFDLGWVELFPAGAPADPGTVVAVLIRHLGFWSVNGCRVVYRVDSDDGGRAGFAYGALTNHAEAGEELFEVFLDPVTDDVRYRIRAISWPQTLLARLGQPIVRILQARFRTDSITAMKRATRGKSADH